MNANGLQGYIITLRKARGLTQEDIADHLRISVRGWRYWETGKTKDKRASEIIRALAFVDGTLADAMLVYDKSYDDGVVLARRRLGE